MSASASFAGDIVPEKDGEDRLFHACALDHERPAGVPITIAGFRFRCYFFQESEPPPTVANDGDGLWLAEVGCGVEKGLARVLAGLTRPACRSAYNLCAGALEAASMAAMIASCPIGTAFITSPWRTPRLKIYYF